MVTTLFDSAEKPKECFDKLSMNGFFSTISIADPFVLSPVEGLRGVIQQNLFFAFIFLADRKIDQTGAR